MLKFVPVNAMPACMRYRYRSHVLCVVLDDEIVGTIAVWNPNVACVGGGWSINDVVHGCWGVDSFCMASMEGWT